MENKMTVEELERCKNDLCYYYNNYVRRKGDPVLRQEQFESLQRQWALIRAGKMIAKPRYKDVYSYPLNENEVYKPE